MEDGEDTKTPTSPSRHEETQKPRYVYDFFGLLVRTTVVVSCLSCDGSARVGEGNDCCRSWFAMLERLVIDKKEFIKSSTVSDEVPGKSIGYSKLVVVLLGEKLLSQPKCIDNNLQNRAVVKSSSRDSMGKT
ncbi:hypothetical protein RUM44_002394 [Polyplax serrata]|uniref:Uncharacterized protein n=1 Tax=Polyplax serrata TaxID=468196 RepID=A0ABR1AG70_POLSC